MDSLGINIGQREIMITAAEKYIKGNTDFGDYMILTEGEQNSSTKFVTFDKAILQEVKGASYP